MKFVSSALMALPLFASSLAYAQPDVTRGTKIQKCMDMKGMDMKDIAAQHCKDMAPGRESQMTTYKTKAVVKELDTSKGKVTLAHEAVKGLSWPAMTMGFSVRDKTLLAKLVVGKQVQVEFRKEGPDYVVDDVR